MTTPKEILVLFIITIIIIIGIIYCKMILIWRDVMLLKNEQTKRDIERLSFIKKRIKMNELLEDLKKEIESCRMSVGGGNNINVDDALNTLKELKEVINSN